MGLEGEKVFKVERTYASIPETTIQSPVGQHRQGSPNKSNSPPKENQGRRNSFQNAELSQNAKNSTGQEKLVSEVQKSKI
ncbi:MAG: hypothetical protein AAGM46_27715 [Cyanobacteria bacterium J06582_2]